MKKNLTRLYIYILILLLLFQCPLYYFRIVSNNSALINILYSCVILGEFFIFSGLFLLFTLKTPQKIKFILSCILFLLLFFYNSIIISQTYTLYLLGSYIPAVAFINIESIRLFITPLTISLIILFTFFALAQTCIIIKIRNNQQQVSRKKLIVSFVLTTIGIILLLLFGGTGKYSNTRQINGPVVDFFEQNRLSKKLSVFLETNIILPDFEEKSWIKDTVYTSDQKFLNNSEHPNIIILVPDGIPARLINGYQKLWGNTNNPLNDLTPHIDDMMTNSFVIDNYYNHTAATYPGLTGTFTSSFPHRGMHPSEIKKIISGERPAPHFSSVFEILKLNGYKSCAISSDGEEVYTPQLFEHIIKVDKTYYPANIHELISRSPSFNYLTDKEIFDSIKNILTQKEEQPVVICTYFVTTHLNINPLNYNGIGYQDNKNIFLNALHNFDNELGKFMDWLKTSPFARNTLVILTTDHTHFPDKEYMNLMEKNPSLAQDFQQHFTDKIPFIIYNTYNLPHYFDAKSKTSLYFASTFLHLLGHKNYRNSFLEGSIFDEELPVDETFVYIDTVHNIYCITNNQIYTLNICQKNEKFNQKIEKIKTYKKLESMGLLFDNQYQPVKP